MKVTTMWGTDFDVFPNTWELVLSSEGHLSIEYAEHKTQRPEEWTYIFLRDVRFVEAHGPDEEEVVAMVNRMIEWWAD